MKIIHRDIKRGELKIKIDSNEDSWYLQSIVEPGDSISGMTERKIKLGGSEEKSKISVRLVHLKIRLEKIDADAGSLRLSGPIIEAPEDIPRGDFHTFALEIGTIITIEKERWSSYALKKLDEAVKSERLNVLIIAFDREEALFALLKNNGYELLLDLKGDVSKKDVEERKGNFYQEILKQLKSYDERYSFTSIIAASPAFWKDYLLKEIGDDPIKRKITLATCSSIDASTIGEILKRPELKSVLEKDKSARELRIVEELLEAIRKDNGAYGVAQVREKLASGNISTLLISENLIKKSRKEGSYDEYDRMMNDAEALNADVRIISSDDAAKMLDGLSGIGALLRWKENYG